MNPDKKLFRLDLSIAVEASDEEEAYQLLTTDETLKQIKLMISKSQGQIKEMFHSDHSKNNIIN